MSVDRAEVVAQLILKLNAVELRKLRGILTGEGGDPTGVGAVIPPDLPLKEDGVAVPFEDWPDDYWESLE